MSEETAQVIKGGETCIEITLSRNANGLGISTRVHPRVEEFFRVNNQSNKVDVRTMTRNWRPLDENKPLFAWVGGERFGDQRIDSSGGLYSVDAVGQPLINANGVLNLSFLRLVGISEGAGVTFTVHGVHSLESLKNLKANISGAARKFYIDYLRPIDVSVRVSTQELRF